MELVSVDIGGTHARFCIATVTGDGPIMLGPVTTLATREHASFETAWEAFASHLGRALPRAAALAIAAPVQGEVIRFNMLKTHYRQPIDWTVASLRETKRELDKMYAIASLYAASPAMIPPEFMAALEDDLNMPEAITVLRRLYSEAVDGVALAGTRLASCGQLLGLFQKSLPEWIGWHPASAAIDELQVQRLINARIAARTAKDFAESDRIRDELVAMGIQLRDGKGPDGELITQWEVKV